MTGKSNSPPKGEPWIWLTRELLASDAWRSVGMNARRFIDFLILEHMARGGKHNGQIKAPHRQLMEFGIAARFVADAIRDAENVGLVECHRGGLRVATTYSLSWLPNHDGSMATGRWRAYRNHDLAPMPTSKSRNLPNKGEAGLPNKGEADEPNLPNKGEADRPKTLPNKGEALLRESYQGGDDTADLSVGGKRNGAAALEQTRAVVVPPAVRPAGFDPMDLPTFLDRRHELGRH